MGNINGNILGDLEWPVKVILAALKLFSAAIILKSKLIAMIIYDAWAAIFIVIFKYLRTDMIASVPRHGICTLEYQLLLDVVYVK